MRRASLFLVTCLLIWAKVVAQGTVRGKVSDTKGETLIGAAVMIKGTSIAVGTDYDGNFSLSIKDTTAVTLEASYFGYSSQTRTVHPRGGEVLIVDFVLKDASIEMKEFTVEGKAARDRATYLDRMKPNAPRNFDFITRDLMIRWGDGDVNTAVKRVTGVSTVGSFITVRGLADRYVCTTVNGGRIPNLDPFTSNIRLDLFPTGMLDNIIITKTATPDLPGDWSGAHISLNTSDYPERFRLSVSSTIGYIPQTTGKEITSAASSSTDWLGWDDGMRGLPEGVSPVVEDFPVFVDPLLYQQLTILGYGATMANYGIVANTPGFATNNMSVTSTLNHVMLAEMGLLPPALLNDPNAVQAAVNAYNSAYGLSYFSPIVNAELAELNPRFDNSRWRIGTSMASPNYNASISLGNQVGLFKSAKKPMTLGYLFGLRYTTETQYDPSSQMMRTVERFEDPIPGDQFAKSGDQRVGFSSNGWNAIGNLSLRIDPNNSISFMGMTNTLGQSNARYLEFLDPHINSGTFISEEQYWEQRALSTVQFRSEHYLSGPKFRITPEVSYSDGERDLLDLMIVQYNKPVDGQSIDNIDGALTPPGRIYRWLNERIWDLRLDLEFPLDSVPNRVRKLKFGGAYRDQLRTNDQAYFAVLDAPGPSQWEDPGRFELGPDGTFDSRYSPYGSFKDNDIGILKVTAGYVMTDFALSRRTRFTGGVRAEHTDLVSDIRKFYEEGLDPEDPARGTVGNLALGGAIAAEPQPAVPGIIDRWDLLPSVNLIYKLRVNDDAPTNLRLSFFRSLGRPSFREFSVVQQYDYLLQAPVFGNPDLEMTSIDNYDLRLEQYFESGNNISLSGFYKSFENHIELLQTLGGGFTWRNAEESWVVGVELEGKVSVWKGSEFRGNLTAMNSRSELTTVISEQEVKYSTPMYGQSPYIVNLMFSQAWDSIGLTLSASYNMQGPRLAVTNSELDPEGVRAYEMPRQLIDLTANKAFGKHWTVNIRVRDLLGTSMRRAYLFETGYDLDFDRYTYGTEYQLTLSYSIR